jgi:hypothetical protein
MRDMTPTEHSPAMDPNGKNSEMFPNEPSPLKPQRRTHHQLKGRAEKILKHARSKKVVQQSFIKLPPTGPEPLIIIHNQVESIRLEDREDEEEPRRDTSDHFQEESRDDDGGYVTEDAMGEDAMGDEGKRLEDTARECETEDALSEGSVRSDDVERARRECIISVHVGSTPWEGKQQVETLVEDDAPDDEKRDTLVLSSVPPEPQSNLSPLVTLEATGSMVDGPASSTHVRQMFERFKEASTHLKEASTHLKEVTSQWTVFRDEELIEALLTREQLQDQHRDLDNKILLMSDAVSTAEIIVDVCAQISKIDLVGTMSSCFDTIASSGCHDKKTLLGYTSESALTEDLSEYNNERDSTSDLSALKSQRASTNDLSEVESQRASIVDREKASTGDQSGIKHARVSTDKDIQLFLNRYKSIMKVDEADSVDDIEGLWDNSQSSGSNNAPTSRNNAPTSQHKLIASAPIDQSSEPLITSVTNTTGIAFGRSSQRQLQTRQPSRVVQRAIFQCYMTFCTLRHQIRHSVAWKTSTASSRQRRSRGRRPEWVQISHKDSMVESLYSDDCVETTSIAALGSIIYATDLAKTKHTRQWTKLLVWGTTPRLTRTKNAPSFSALTCYDEASVLVDEDLITRVEI